MNSDAASDLRAQYREEQVVVLDYIKHLTTLATGAVVLIAALLEKLFPLPQARWLVVLALGAFAVTVTALTLSALGVIRSVRDLVAGGSANVAFTSASFIVGLMAFLLGLLSLSAFAIINLL